MSDELCLQVTSLLMQSVSPQLEKLTNFPGDNALIISLFPDLPWRFYVYETGLISVRCYNEINIPIALAQFNYKNPTVSKVLTPQYARQFVAYCKTMQFQE
jgi:hypothetical protein